MKRQENVSKINISIIGKKKEKKNFLTEKSKDSISDILPKKDSG